MRDWWPSLTVGALGVGFLVFWFGAVSVTSESATAPHGLIEYAVHRYQTLLAGLFAIAAAVIGAHALRSQIEQDDRLSKDERDRKARATRAMVPLALSNLMDYAEQCLNAMNVLRQQCIHEALPCPVPNPPSQIQWPDEALILLRDYLEHADHQAAVPLVALISKLQIQRSRSAEVFRHAAGTPARATPLSINLETYTIDAAEIYARSGALFSHARHGYAITPISSQDVLGALNIMGMDDTTDPTIYGRVRSRANWELTPR